MSKGLDNITIEDILSKVRVYIDDEEQVKVIEKAYQFAKNKHEGQYRKSGEDYIYHPMNVALILTITKQTLIRERSSFSAVPMNMELRSISS